MAISELLKSNRKCLVSCSMRALQVRALKIMHFDFVEFSFSGSDFFGSSFVGVARRVVNLYSTTRSKVDCLEIR